MTVSDLADGCVLSPNYTPSRWNVTRLTPHHTAMIGDAWDIANVFKPTSRQASCNYAIGVDGSIVCVVPEEYRAWTSSSYDNDMQAITFELSDCDYDWNISKATQEAFINLCVDLIRRYPSLGGSFNWTGDMSGNVTVHRWFAATACPGDPLFNMLGRLGDEINRRLGGERFGVPMECILHPDECGTLFYVCGQDITPLGCPDNMSAIDKLADKCGESVPHVELGTKEAPWGWRFFQACGKEDIYNRYVLGNEPEPQPAQGDSAQTVKDILSSIGKALQGIA